MKKIIDYMRINEWIASKVTMMMGVFVYFLYICKTNEFLSLIGIIVFFLFVSAFMAISYIANDYSDLEVDKKAGKKKVIAGMKKWQIWLGFVAIFLLGTVPLVFYCQNKVFTIVLIIMIYFLGLAYSTLGIRFKEKGIWGLIECSFAQRCMPLMIIYVMIPMDNMRLLLLCGWIVISFLDGLRYIIIHQIVDLENDLKSGVVTFVLQKRKNYRNLLVILCVAEIIGSVIILFPIMRDHIIIFGIIIIAFGILEYGIYKVLNVFAKKDWFCTFDSVPLEAFWNCGMPLMLGICMCINNIYILIFIIILLAVCFKPMLVKMEIAEIYFVNKKRIDKN